MEPEAEHGEFVDKAAAAQRYDHLALPKRKKAHPRAPQRAPAVFEVELGSRRALVLSFPGDRASGDPLSSAERQLFLLLLCGQTARQIAAFRGTTVRTVSKQIEAVYRKLGVRSRSELSSRFSLDGPGAALKRERGF